MQTFRNLLLRKDVFIFLFAIAVAAGPALVMLMHYDVPRYCTDCWTYTGISGLHFHQESAARKYRIILPLIAGAINFSFGKIFSVIEPRQFPGDFPLQFSFLLTNLMITGIYAVVIFRYSRSYGASFIACLIGLLVMLTSQWSAYATGIPMTDTFYYLMVGVALLAIRLKDTRLLLLAIFLGPFSKETFFFMAPVIFFFGHLPKFRLFLLLSLSALLFLSYHYTYDLLTGASLQDSIKQLYHTESTHFKNRALNLFTSGILYAIGSVIGLWLFIPALAMLYVPHYLKTIGSKLQWYMLAFFLVVLAHMVFGAFQRHFYLAMPIICLLMALSVDELKKRYSFLHPDL